MKSILILLVVSICLPAKADIGWNIHEGFQHYGEPDAIHSVESKNGLTDILEYKKWTINKCYETTIVAIIEGKVRLEIKAQSEDYIDLLSMLRLQ